MSALLGRDAKRMERFKGSLGYVAHLLGKNPRTIRRWCEGGLIPGAYQTAGGQWRVSGMCPAIARSIQAKARAVGFYPRCRRGKRVKTRLADLRARRPQRSAEELARELMITGAKLRKQEVAEEFTMRKVFPKGFYHTRGFTEEQEAALNDAPSVQLLKGVRSNPFRAEAVIESRNLAMLLKKKPITRRMLAARLCIAEVTLKRRMIKSGISMGWIYERLFEWS